MPAEQSAFTVINAAPGAPPALGAPPRSVLVVRPQPRAAAAAAARSALDPKFSRALDLKLRRLKDKEALEATLRPRARRAEPAMRPRFVTTVKTGQFLLPPPEVASLLGLPALQPAPRERVVFQYASRPEPVVPRARRPPGEAFRGVRALAAGVAGMRRLLEERDSLSVPRRRSQPRARVPRI